VDRAVHEVRMLLQDSARMRRKFPLIFKLGFGERITLGFVDAAPMLPKIIVDVCRVVQSGPAAGFALCESDVLV